MALPERVARGQHRAYVSRRDAGMSPLRCPRSLEGKDRFCLTEGFAGRGSATEGGVLSADHAALGIAADGEAEASKDQCIATTA
jgi:hypothetical protein